MADVGSFDPDAYLASTQAPPAAQPAPDQSGGFDPDSYIQAATEEKYGSPGQTIGAGIEGVAKGLIPAAPYLEKHLLRIPGQDIEGRSQAHPIVQGVGEGLGLATGALTGTGVGGVAADIGEGAEALAGLKALKGAEGFQAYGVKGPSYGFKVGSSVVKNAAEMAAIQGNDEANKMLMKDPGTSAESAIANVGLAAALGGAGGAIFTGAVNPLWEATAGPQVDKILNTLKNHLDGTSGILPADLDAALKANGIQMPEVMRAAAAGDQPSIQRFNELREAQHPEVMKALEDLHQANAQSVMDALGVMPDQVVSYSENEGGQAIRDKFLEEYKAKYEPQQKAMEARNAEAATISIPDDERLKAYGRLVEQGMQIGTDSPYYKLYEDWGNRILARDTVGGLDGLKTELGGEISKAVRSGDTNSLNALRDIRKSIADFQENQIAKQGESLEKMGVKGAKGASADLLNQRAETNRNYAQFAGMSDELMDHLGVGEFRGAGSLAGKLKDLSPEQIANKFSPKGNVDSIPFLAKHFPETLEAVRQNETNRVIKPAVASALKKGDIPIDYNKLHDIITKGMQGSPEYTKFAIPQAGIDAINNAKTISNAVPKIKSSGTAGWMTKMYAHMPASALSAVALVTGHNPFAGTLAGVMAQKLGRDVPDAYKLAMLKFLGSQQEVKAGGFKAMVDYAHAVAKGENQLANATKAVFKSGAQVLGTNMIPDSKDLAKLDRQVTNMQNNPEQLLNTQTHGQLGHYMPEHQQALSQATTTQLQYLQSLKPTDHSEGPLDRPIAPSKAETARYNRALTIAQQPATVLQHIKDGTLQTSDIQDLNALYPNQYSRMKTQLSNQMQATKSDEDQIPYRTRLSLSLFLGQPLDSSMNPTSIIAAQPQPKAPPPQGPVKNGGKSMKSLSKGPNSYKTASQEAESDRSSRD